MIKVNFDVAFGALKKIVPKGLIRLSYTSVKFRPVGVDKQLRVSHYYLYVYGVPA